MKYLALLLFSIHFSSEASIEKILSSLVKPELANCSLEEPDQFYFETDEAFNGNKKIQCPDDERSWFRNIHLAYCTSRFGATGFTCVENNVEKIQKRVANQVLMEKMTSYAQKKFQEYKGQLTSECCADKKNVLNDLMASH